MFIIVALITGFFDSCLGCIDVTLYDDDAQYHTPKDTERVLSHTHTQTPQHAPNVTGI